MRTLESLFETVIQIVQFMDLNSNAGTFGDTVTPWRVNGIEYRARDLRSSPWL